MALRTWFLCAVINVLRCKGKEYLDYTIYTKFTYNSFCVNKKMGNPFGLPINTCIYCYQKKSFIRN